MARFLGIDYGTRRIGVAISDPGETIASPLTMLDARGRVVEDVRNALACADEHDADAFVIGLPLNMDGSEGGQAKLTRRFGDQIAAASGKPVHYFDERLSSAAAEELLVPAELTRKKRKARLDAVAAQIILQDFLDARAADDVSDTDVD